jgi:hypothetical protein
MGLSRRAQPQECRPAGRSQRALRPPLLGPHRSGPRAWGPTGGSPRAPGRSAAPGGGAGGGGGWGGRRRPVRPRGRSASGEAGDGGGPRLAPALKHPRLHPPSPAAPPHLAGHRHVDNVRERQQREGDVRLLGHVACLHGGHDALGKGQHNLGGGGAGVGGREGGGQQCRRSPWPTQRAWQRRARSGRLEGLRASGKDRRRAGLAAAQISCSAPPLRAAHGAGPQAPSFSSQVPPPPPPPAPPAPPRPAPRTFSISQQPRRFL